jgi:hypothetical protein
LPQPLPVPVIDINKLPRYGVLAPPIERPEKQAGKFVDLDRATQVFVKNRGVLREAVEGKGGVRGLHHAYQLSLQLILPSGPILLLIFIQLSSPMHPEMFIAVSQVS